MHNVGFVAQLLTLFYPNTNEPALPTQADQAAAVQAAIWYFSDHYVLSISDPLHDAVAGIVTTVQNKGPLVEPPAPSLSITPTSVSGPQGSLVGPFTVHSATTGVATLTAVGADAFSDAAGATLLPPGSTVFDGASVWLRARGSARPCS